MLVILFAIAIIAMFEAIVYDNIPVFLIAMATMFLILKGMN